MLVSIAILAAAPSVRAEETCVRCHATHVDARLRRPAYAVPRDVHGANAATCTQCHGGDPTVASVRAHDLGAGFVGRPDRLGIARLCGGCHDGSRDDAPAVLVHYRGGRHARALVEGRLAATCTSCHGAHGIGHPREGTPDVEERAPSTRDAGSADAGADAPDMASSDPHRELAPGGSAVRAAIVAECIACHSSAETMRASELPTDQASQWARSVHGRAVAEGNERAPDCASCHDPHHNDAGLAAVRSCGGCHEELRAAFERGPHGARFARLGFLDCAECHGNHEVEPASASMLTGLTAVCTRCHGNGQEVFETVRAIAAQAAALDRARAVLPREDPRRAEMISALHALDAEGLARAIESAGELGEPEAEPGAIRRTSEPWWALFLKAGGLVLLGVLAVWLVRRSRRLP